MPRSIPPAIFVVTLTAAAVAASVALFGGRGPVTDAPELVGTWDLNGLALGNEVRLALHSDGRYAIATASRSEAEPSDELGARRKVEGPTEGGSRSEAEPSDELGTFDLAECGRWRSLEGRFQMRAVGGTRIESPRVLLLSQPGLRLGSVNRAVSSGASGRETVELLLKPAKRGAPEERWRLTRAGGFELRAGDGKAGRRLRERCAL